jgi:hypothetical protein
MNSFNLEKAKDILSKIDNWEIELKQENIFKKDIKKVYQAKNDKLEYLKNNGWRLWPTTPFKEIDKITKWFKKWWLIGIWWFSNAWKSQISYIYAQHFLKLWLQVAYFSLEVSSEDVLIYINQYYYWINYKEAVKKEYNENFNKLNIYDVSDYYKIEEIEKYVIKYKPDIIFIDFIQILEMPWNSEYEKISSWIRRLQRLWIDTWTTIIYLSQISNESIKEKNILDINLKWSWSLIASSDYVFIIKKWNVNWEIIYWLKKNKHGPAYKMYSLLLDFENWKYSFDWEYNQNENNLFN